MSLRTTTGTGLRLLGWLHDPRLGSLFLKTTWACFVFLPVLPGEILLVRSTYDGIPSFFNRSWAVHAKLRLSSVAAVFGWERALVLYLTGWLEGVAALLAFVAVVVGAVYLAVGVGQLFG